MYGVPVVWLSSSGTTVSNTPVIPTAPLWSDANTTASIPSGVIGVEYRDIDGTLAQGTTVQYQPDESVTITAVARPGYILNGTTTWTHKFPNTATLTLVGSDSFSGGGSPTLVGRVFDNKVVGATTGVGTAAGPLRWYQVGPGSQPLWGDSDPGHPYNAGSIGHAIDGAGGFAWVPRGPAPVLGTPVISATGGSLPAGDYYYKVTAVVPRGETGAGFQKEVKVTTTGSTSKVTLTWASVSGATAYKVYRGTTTGASFTLPGRLLATVTGTSFVDNGSLTPGVLTPWHYDNVNGRPCFNAGRSWVIEFDVTSYNYTVAPYIILDAFSDAASRSQQIQLRSTSATSTTCGTLPNGEPIVGRGIDGTWRFALMPGGSFTVTAPNKQETHMTFSSTIANDTALRWARLGYYTNVQVLATRIKNLKVYKFGA